jgi:FeS assembly SUF system protein
MEGKTESVEETQQASAATPNPTQTQGIEEKVVEVLRTVFDPEIPINIYELGLVYNVDVTPTADVVIRMTLTSPACPVAGTLPPEVENKVRAIPGVTSAKVDLVWDPPWSMENISEAAKLELGML